MDTRPIGPKPKPGKPKPEKSNNRGYFGKPKPGNKTARTLIDLLDDSKKKKKSYAKNQVGKKIAYTITAAQNRIKGGKKGPGKVGKLAR